MSCPTCGWGYRDCKCKPVKPQRYSNEEMIKIEQDAYARKDELPFIPSEEQKKLKEAFNQGFNAGRDSAFYENITMPITARNGSNMDNEIELKANLEKLQAELDKEKLAHSKTLAKLQDTAILIADLNDGLGIAIAQIDKLKEGLK